MDGTGTSFAPMAAFIVSYGLLVMLPGPNTAVAVRAGLTMSRSARTTTVIGIALGASVLVTITAILTMMLPVGNGARQVFVTAAGLVLLGLGARLMLAARPITHLALPSPSGQGFGVAFLTAVSNPTTALFFVSSSLSIAGFPPVFRVALMAAGVFAVAALWFSLVSWMLSWGPLRHHSLRYMRVIDTGAALMLMAFGLAMIMRPS